MVSEKVGVLDHGYVLLVNHMGQDIDVANSARVSYDKRSEPDENGNLQERDVRLIDFLLREQHTSPFRHQVVSYEVYAPLFVARQWWRYMVSSTHTESQNGWSESSRRYITEEPAFYVPGNEEWRASPEDSKQGSGENLPPGIGSHFTGFLKEYVERGEELYERAMSQGICAEQARAFLPAYNMYVRWKWTSSLQTILHFLQQRLANDSQFEIQEYARAVYSLTSPFFPASFEAFEKYNATNN